MDSIKNFVIKNEEIFFWFLIALGVLFVVLWPIIYLVKYGFTSGFKRTGTKKECSRGIYTTYRNCSGLQKLGRAVWDIYTTLWLIWFIFFNILSYQSGHGSFSFSF